MKLAPIGLTVYTRLSHVKKAISALKENDLALESELFIFSDGPRKGDEEKVQEMRKYLKTVDGFKEVHLIFRDENSRLKNNRGGQKYLLDLYGKIIWMAEDIITAPGFLRFMNENLEYYKNNSEILSITGYTPDINADKYIEKDNFFIKRYNAWGFGIWKDRYESIPAKLDKEEYKKTLLQKEYLVKIKEYGEDILSMLEFEVAEKIDALDVRAIYWQIINDKYTVYPKKSLVQNIGHDGTGVHCGVTDKFNIDLWSKNKDFILESEVNEVVEIIKTNQEFRKLGFKTKLKAKLRKVLKKEK